MARLDVCILLTRAAVNTGDIRVERSSSEISDSLAANPSPAIRFYCQILSIVHFSSSFFYMDSLIFTYRFLSGEFNSSRYE